VASMVQKLLLNFVTRPKIPLNASHPVFSDDGRPGVLQRVGSAAGNVDPFLQQYCFYEFELLYYLHDACHVNVLRNMSSSKFSLNIFRICQQCFSFLYFT
jgi:hypothetical protein